MEGSVSACWGGFCKAGRPDSAPNHPQPPPPHQHADAPLIIVILFYSCEISAAGAQHYVLVSLINLLPSINPAPD